MIFCEYTSPIPGSALRSALLAELMSTSAAAAGGGVCAIMAWPMEGRAPYWAMAAPPTRPNASRMVRVFCDRPCNFPVIIVLSPDLFLVAAQCYTNRSLHDLVRRRRRSRDCFAPIQFPAHHIQPINTGLERTGKPAEKGRLLLVLKEVELRNDVVAFFARLHHLIEIFPVLLSPAVH